jgi:hypothetical protein
MNPLEEESNGRIKTFHPTVHQTFVSIKIPNQKMHEFSTDQELGAHSNQISIKLSLSLSLSLSLQFLLLIRF